jgi:hypothetical protein
LQLSNPDLRALLDPLCKLMVVFSRTDALLAHVQAGSLEKRLLDSDRW